MRFAASERKASLHRASWQRGDNLFCYCCCSRRRCCCSTTAASAQAQTKHTAQGWGVAVTSAPVRELCARSKMGAKIPAGLSRRSSPIMHLMLSPRASSLCAELITRGARGTSKSGPRSTQIPQTAAQRRPPTEPDLMAKRGRRFRIEPALFRQSLRQCDLSKRKQTVAKQLAGSRRKTFTFRRRRGELGKKLLENHFRLHPTIWAPVLLPILTSIKYAFLPASTA